MTEKTYSFKRPEYFDLNQIFDCGQCFRFDKCEDTENTYEGVAFGKYIHLMQDDDTVTLCGADEKDYLECWNNFLSTDIDYSAVRDDIAERFGGDKTISSAMEFGKGIRILRQDPWETVCSFIVSQNNNIPRIKKIISALSRKYGNIIEHNGNTYYSFPSPESLAEAGEKAIFDLKTGFRAGYIYDAAKKVASGELDLQRISKLSTEELLDALMTVKGIGPKVASCAALFGFGKTDAFPVDVWVKRVIAKYYPDGLDVNSLGKYAGVAQQYLFYYERYQ